MWDTSNLEGNEWTFVLEPEDSSATHLSNDGTSG